MKFGQIKDAIVDAQWSFESKTGNTMTFAKTFGKKRNARIIHFSITFEENGGYSIKHPSYEFHSTVSLLKSTQEDYRKSLNTSYISRIIKLLKHIGLWPEIINKDFVTVNDWNKKSDKGRVRKIVSEFLEV